MAKKSSKPKGTMHKQTTVVSFLDQETVLPSGYPITVWDYQIAVLAWSKGLSSNSILSHFQLEKTPQNITRVRRALEKAVRHGLIALTPPRNVELEDQLREAFPALQDISVEVDRTAVCLKAAKLIAEEIEAFLGGPETQFIIANAGGRTVRDTIDCLQRLIPVPPYKQGKALCFLSLNAAGAHDRYDECANFLSVRMAQIYDAQHFAVVKHGDQETDVAYRDAVLQIDLVISSAGERVQRTKDRAGGFLADWLMRRDIALPDEVVGDVAFHAIDKWGAPIELNKEMKHLIEDELLPMPDWHHLARLFRNHRVLLVLGDNKIDVSYALLDSALAQRCILDSNLAAVLAGRKKAIANDL